MNKKINAKSDIVSTLWVAYKCRQLRYVRTYHDMFLKWWNATKTLSIVWFIKKQNQIYPKKGPAGQKISSGKEILKIKVEGS